MSFLLDYAPQGPHWTVDWDGLLGTFGWLASLQGCPQDPTYHEEGDVATHTRLVLEELSRLEGFRSLPERDRGVVFVACLMHDLGKPAVTCVGPEDRFSSPGHARKGASSARQILYKAGFPFQEREDVVALIHHHEVPFYLADREDGERVAIRVSQTARCDLLALVAQADARGRRCSGQNRLLEQIELYRLVCEDVGCWQEPFRFPSAQSRFEYFRTENRSPRYQVHDETRCEVIVLSGLPGAGKDRWLKEHAEGRNVVSLDQLRAVLGTGPEQEQGAVVAAARDRARELLRKGEGYVWNATNVSRDLRQSCVALAAQYNARVRIVYVEVPWVQLQAQNRQRPDAVPEPVLGRLLRRWQVPDRTEAQTVDYIVEG